MISLFKHKPRLAVIMDDWNYIRTNCYQHQLYFTLAKRFRIKRIEYHQIAKPGSRLKLDPKIPILSTMRLRTLVRSASTLVAYLDGRPLVIYDQDPWESFRDDSPFKGSYKILEGSLNVSRFLNTSGWWADYVACQGHRTGFVRMGLLESHCSASPSWEERKIQFGFQGSVHPYRRAFFDVLEKEGIHVQITPATGYSGFLKTLSNTRVFPCAEPRDFTLEGKSYNTNSAWIKMVEAVGRGCFALRSLDEEGEEYYQMGEFPTFFGFRDESEIPAITERILSMNPAERNQRMKGSSEHVRKRRDWESVYKYLET